MMPQGPAEGILINRDFGDARQYSVICECGSADCSHRVWVEAEDIGVSVVTHTTQKTRFWEANRWQLVWRLLVRGYVEYEAAIYMTEQQALNYAAALQSAVKDVKLFKKQINTLEKPQ
jgi:hypothetical protein